MKKAFKKKNFYLYIALVMSLMSCSKGSSFDYEVRAHEILKCKINGKNWVPVRTHFFAVTTYDLDYYSDTGHLSLNAANLREDVALNGGLVMYVNDLKVGENQFLEKEDIYFVSNNENTSECEYYYELDANSHNHFTVESIDTVNYIIIGTFAFSATNECNDIIRVTDGEFDLKYHL